MHWHAASHRWVSDVGAIAEASPDRSEKDAASQEARPTMASAKQSPYAPQKASQLAELLNPKGNSLRTVLIIYTGGTIGMQEMENGSLGLVPRTFQSELKQMKEINQQNVPQCYFYEFNPILDSADMSSEDWCKIASYIEAAYYDYDGFVILHGTDTMAYTASALSFMLEQLAKPVILTGSQLPFRRPITDARQNFLGAITIAGVADLAEVCIFFGGKLYRGNRCKKVDASAMEAFHSPNYGPLAEVGTEITICRRRLRDPPRGKFRLHAIDVTDIAVVWVIPGFSDDFFSSLTKSKTIKGMVLMLYGCGNAPARKKTFLDSLQEMHRSGIVVVACSQCTRGKVVLEKYAVGKAFADCGVVAGSDMTAEATVTKLAYLFSKGLSPEECRVAMTQNLRGEVTIGTETLDISETLTHHRQNLG
eukprot:TRINITY_DN35207_c0_g1_i1.p1 TRINITY_DN35207_c0_g1~~TRINITY_DN35207_c0_g1_i1.p1  ORF type:complete len:421 (+),score=68.21 TRINITY_DN35207_c0_g1_i1:87-1349(+)